MNAHDCPVAGPLVRQTRLQRLYAGAQVDDFEADYDGEKIPGFEVTWPCGHSTRFADQGSDESNAWKLGYRAGQHVRVCNGRAPATQKPPSKDPIDVELDRWIILLSSIVVFCLLCALHVF